MVFPQNRDDFSIAAELSTSNVVGLAWSPPGLGRFRRCVLAVLTSNLILSLWEPVGAKGQWARVAVVNHALHASQDNPTELEGIDFRKTNIRSFSWCPPLKVPFYDGGCSELPPSPECRWGMHVLAVANDVNDVILIRVQRLAPPDPLSRQYHCTKMALYGLEDEEQYPSACPGSLFRAALELKTRVTSISCGPWLPVANEHSVITATAVVAALQGTRVRLLKATIAVTWVGWSNSYQADAELKYCPPRADLAWEWTSQPITGPLKWLHTVC